MNWKRMKRVLAASLAAMLAFPPNIYGTPIKVQAEQVRSVVTQFYSIDYLNDEEYLVGSTEDYIRKTLPDQLLVSYTDVQAVQQNLEEESAVSVPADEDMVEEAPVEEDSVSVTTDENTVEETSTDENTVKEEPAKENSEEDPMKEIQTEEPETDEVPEEETPADTVSSAIGFLKSLVPQPLIVHAKS